MFPVYVEADVKMSVKKLLREEALSRKRKFLELSHFPGISIDENAGLVIVDRFLEDYIDLIDRVAIGYDVVVNDHYKVNVITRSMKEILYDGRRFVSLDINWWLTDLFSLRDSLSKGKLHDTSLSEVRLFGERPMYTINVSIKEGVLLLKQYGVVKALVTPSFILHFCSINKVLIFDREALPLQSVYVSVSDESKVLFMAGVIAQLFGLTLTNFGYKKALAIEPKEFLLQIADQLSPKGQMFLHNNISETELDNLITIVVNHNQK